MKHILIIGARESGTKNNPVVMAQMLGDEGTLRIDVAYWEDLVVAINRGRVSVASPRGELGEQSYQLVIALGWYKSGRKLLYRDLAFATGLYLTHHGIPFWNKEMVEQRSISKLSCLVQLALHDIAVTDTVFSLSNRPLETATVPFVAKAASASRGQANFLITDEMERTAIDRTSAYFLVQPFLPNDHDLRVICMGGAPQLILKRSRSADAMTHLNNTSQGAAAQWLSPDEIPDEVLTNASKICKIVGRELAGIDFIPDASSPYGYSCLEVNAIPQLTSGQDVEKKMEQLKKVINESSL